MERGEDLAQKSYVRYLETLLEAKHIREEENAHEQQLISMIYEERLQFAGSIVLGLNDALVELTGALAGSFLCSLKYRLSHRSFLYPETMNTFAIRFLCFFL